VEQHKFQKEIKNFRSLSQWNQIIDLIITENLSDIWHQVYKAEALHKLSRKQEAKTLFDKIFTSADKLNPHHMFLIGKSFEILGDTSKSFLWYNTAASLGEINAQNNLGVYYVNLNPFKRLRKN
jgi:tetratricopeptide (TPR) repeat protein